MRGAIIRGKIIREAIVQTISNLNFGIILKTYPSESLVNLQTDTIFIQSLSNIYEKLLILEYFFRNTIQCPEAIIHGCSAKALLGNFTKFRGKHCVGLSISMQFQDLRLELVKKRLQQRFFRGKKKSVCIV